MTEAEAKNYIKRFPDVSYTSLLDPKEMKKLAKAAKNKGETFVPGQNAVEKNPVQAARDHYDTYGHFERRNTKLAYRITDNQADCYLRRYQDLGDAFGDAANPTLKAKKHWYKFGFKEKRDPRCYSAACVDQTTAGGEKGCKDKY